MLYEMLTGERPFKGDGPALIAGVLRDRPKLPSQVVATLPSAVDEIVMRCLEKSPARRYASAQQVVRALDSINVTAPVTTRTITQEGSDHENESVPAERALRAEAAEDESPLPVEPGRRRRAALVAGAVAAGIAALIAVLNTPGRDERTAANVREAADADAADDGAKPRMTLLDTADPPCAPAAVTEFRAALRAQHSVGWSPARSRYLAAIAAGGGRALRASGAGHSAEEASRCAVAARGLRARPHVRARGEMGRGDSAASRRDRGMQRARSKAPTRRRRRAARTRSCCVDGGTRSRGRSPRSTPTNDRRRCIVRDGRRRTNQRPRRPSRYGPRPVAHVYWTSYAATSSMVMRVAK